MDAFLRRALGSIDEHGGLAIESVEWTGDELSLRVRVVDPDGTEERWGIAVRDVREHRVELVWTDALTFTDDHPLLWPHLGEQAELFFSRRPHDPSSMVGRLYERHRRETGGWHPFERFVNQHMHLGRLLDAGAGLLASGPVRLLAAYSEELAAASVPFSVAGRRPAQYWKPHSQSYMAGGRFIIEDEPLDVLTVGDSYVVAAGFTARQEPGSARVKTDGTTEPC